MNKLQQLTQKVRRLIDPCDECKGKSEMAKCMCHRKDHEGACLGLVDCDCNGKGYVEELELGCIVKDNWHSDVLYGKVLYTSHTHVTHMGLVKDGEDTYWKSHTLPKQDVENLGKPLTLREILLALSQEINPAMDTGYRNYIQVIPSNANRFMLPLTITPQEYPEELLDQLIKLL